MNEKDEVYTKLEVWIAGDKNAKIPKKELFLNVIFIIIIAVFYITLSSLFKNERTLTVLSNIFIYLYSCIFCLIVFGWIILSCIYDIVKSYKVIKNNKLITLYLYKMNVFVNNVKYIPDDAVVLFIDSDGIVLVDKQYDDRLDYILMNISSFNDFYKYK